MNKFIIFSFTLLISFFSFAQQPKPAAAQVNVKGKVIDFDTKENLEYATIVLKPLNGSAISGGITDSHGKFNIDVAAGKYDISVEFISFKTKTYKNQELKENLDLGTIELQINAEALDEVEIIAEKSTVEIRLDKKIYNVGKDMTVKGGTASDVLDNVPSVSVDVEGNVSLRGNENVRILINGKPSGMVGLSTDALRQLPADAIEKVEVITSPSARYEAEGTAGILNIVLRKGKAQGFNASLTANAGVPENFGGSANLNYRIEKVNFFTNTGYNYSNAPGNSSANVTYFNYDGDVLGYRDEVSEIERERNRFNTNFGLEYYISDKTSVVGTIYYRDSKGDELNTNTSNELDANYILSSTDVRLDSGNDKDSSLEYSFNLTHDFNDSGHKLTVDLQYGTEKEDQKSQITDQTIYPIFVENNPERTTTNDTSNDVLIQSDYVLPIGEKAQFEAGFKIDLNDLDSDYLVEDYDPITGEYYNNTNFSNSLNFKQNIYSVYSQYGSKINKFSYLVGLRAETTDRTIVLLNNGEDSYKKWTELFPTVNLGLAFNDSESLTLGYNKRLRRPRSWFLNPFESRTSETFIRKGNVNLDPTYTDSFDLGYLKRWNKFNLSSSIYYQHATNNIEFAQTEEIREVNGEDTLIIVAMPINLSSEDRFGFEFTANYNPFKWWKLMSSFNFFRAISEGDYNGVNYDSDDVSWFTRFNSTVTFPKLFDWQTTAMYMGPSQGAQTKREGMVSVNLAFSKDILKEKATLSLNISDLLNSRKRESTTTTETTFSQNEFQWRQRQVMLNFTYRFNQKKKRERSPSYDGGEEEMFKA
jgi:hypothetical protein